MITLPVCNSVPACPKCSAVDAAISTVYHDLPQPLTEAVPDPCTRLVMESASEELEDFGEHLCRRCFRCGFGWVERTADAEEDAPEDAGD